MSENQKQQQQAEYMEAMRLEHWKKYFPAPLAEIMIEMHGYVGFDKAVEILREACNRVNTKCELGLAGCTEEEGFGGVMAMTDAIELKGKYLTLAQAVGQIFSWRMDDVHLSWKRKIREHENQGRKDGQ